MENRVIVYRLFKACYNFEKNVQKSIDNITPYKKDVLKRYVFFILTKLTK